MGVRMVYDDVNVKTCLFCGKELSGRCDKKYCDDGCRNNHHYQMKKDGEDAVVKIINNVLFRNREILMSLNKRRKIVVKRHSLENNNFDFEMVTKIYKTKKGNEYRMVYDYAYRFLNDEDVLLLKFTN